MSKDRHRPAKPVKALRLLPDGSLFDPNVNRTFRTAQDAADFWKGQEKVLAAVNLVDFSDIPPGPPELKTGDAVLKANGLWAAFNCGPAQFRSEKEAAAFGVWKSVGGDRTIVSGKSFPACFDDILHVALFADSSIESDQARAAAASTIGQALTLLLGSVPWINPRLDVTLSVSSEFIQAAVLTGTSSIPGFRFRAPMDGGLEIFTDDLSFDCLDAGKATEDADFIGAVSFAAAHIKAAAKGAVSSFPVWTATSSSPKEMRLIATNFGIGTFREGATVIANPRRTAFFVWHRGLTILEHSGASAIVAENWNFIVDAQTAKTIWSSLENSGALLPAWQK